MPASALPGGGGYGRAAAWAGRVEQPAGSAGACAERSALFCVTSWSLSWRDVDLMDGPLGG